MPFARAAFAIGTWCDPCPVWLPGDVWGRVQIESRGSSDCVGP